MAQEEMRADVSHLLAPFTLGVRLDVDFDQFFRRDDALSQLQHWRKAIATTVLGLSSPQHLRLQRVRRGSLDLEFVVEVDSGVTDAELQQRLNQEADRLRALFQEPLLEVRVGADPPENDGQGTGRSASPRAPVTEGLERGALASPSPKPGILRRSSPWHSQDEEARHRLEERVRAAEADYGWAPESSEASLRYLQERIRAVESEYGLNLPLEQRFAQVDAGARRFLDRQGADLGGKPTRAVSMNRSSYPKPPEGPRFLMGDSYWEQRQGERIREQREALIRRGLLREEPEVPPFRAKPVPVAVYAPRPQAQGHSLRRSDCIEGEDTEEQPFRARPVPWRVSTPMYDQILVEERESRQSQQRARSLQMLRSASLPPRLEAEARARRERQDLREESPRPFQPWHGEPYSARRWRASDAQKASRDVGKTLALSENVPRSPAAFPGGPPTRGQRPRSASRPEREVPRDPPTTEVPDFAARHERIKRQLERRKYMNRFVTQPEPFVFNTPTRSQSRQPPMPKDPTRDWRYHRVRGPPSTQPPAPVRSTEKVTSYQLATLRKLQERRLKEMREEEELKEVPNDEMKFRVKQAMGKVEPLEQKIDQIVSDKRRGLQRTQRQKAEDLRNIMERANSRPLLMQQADSLVRAKRRALFRVRNALRQAGVRDVNRHFADDELEEMERGEDEKESYGYTTGTEPLTEAVTQGSLFRP